jgi:hypothetical protein
MAAVVRYSRELSDERFTRTTTLNYGREFSHDLER